MHDPFPDHMAAQAAAGPPPPACRVCGCTDDDACAGGCAWVPDPSGPGPLCSVCLPDVAPRIAELLRLDRAAQLRREHPLIRATAMAVLAGDDRDRVHALRRALRGARDTLEAVRAVLEGRAYVGPLRERVECELHEVHVALSLEHGEA